MHCTHTLICTQKIYIKMDNVIYAGILILMLSPMGVWSAIHPYAV
jgi:hypothetical protein